MTRAVAQLSSSREGRRFESRRGERFLELMYIYIAMLFFYNLKRISIVCMYISTALLKIFGDIQNYQTQRQYAQIRVTRLSEFSLIGRLFSLDSFF
jgi:hypothetical protein